MRTKGTLAAPAFSMAALRRPRSMLPLKGKETGCLQRFVGEQFEHRAAGQVEVGAWWW